MTSLRKWSIAKITDQNILHTHILVVVFTNTLCRGSGNTEATTTAAQLIYPLLNHHTNIDRNMHAQSLSQVKLVHTTDFLVLVSDTELHPDSRLAWVCSHFTRANQVPPVESPLHIHFNVFGEVFHLILLTQWWIRLGSWVEQFI